MIGLCIFDIFLHIFSYPQDFSPSVLLKANINIEVRFYYTVLSFNLAVNLRIKQNIKFLFNV